MTDYPSTHYPRTPTADYERQQGGHHAGKLYRQDERTSSFTSVPLGEVITEQPMQSYGYQVPPGMPPGTYGRAPPVQNMNMISPHVGIPLPGFESLERIPGFKIHNPGILKGHPVCKPGYAIYSIAGEEVFTGTSDTLFCPFDSKQKAVSIKDHNEDCIFQVRFTPSICECDSEEKRCFAVFSPAFDNPFGAVIFEAGQIKYSLKIINALEGETYFVHFNNSSADISIKGADGSVVALISAVKRRGENSKYTITFMEELSSANKALFLSCLIMLDLVSCEGTCTHCICLAPLALGCLTVLGLMVGSYTSNKGVKP